MTQAIYAVIWQDFGTLMNLRAENYADARNKAQKMRDIMKARGLAIADTVKAVCVPAGETKLQYLD